MAASMQDTHGRTALEVLAWSRDTIDPALRDAVATLPEAMRRIAGYHLGWLDEDGHPTDAGAGKALRPALALLAAGAAGGTPDRAVPAAVAVELVHNFSLLHDDVIDGDTTRRHRPTAWRVFGSSQAILAGDSLLTLAFDVLARSGSGSTGDALRVLSRAVQRLIAGQSADIALERRTDGVELAECMTMIRRKTGALMGCACALGAVSAGAGPRRVAGFNRFGERVGVAFQVVDDLLGIWGDPGVTGKPVHAYLARRKKSVPVVAALASGGGPARDLAAFYADERPLSPTELARMAELVAEAGGRSWSQDAAEELLVEGERELAAAVAPDGAAPTEPSDDVARAVAELVALAELIARRDR